MVIGDHHQSSDYLECEKTEKWWNVEVHHSEEKKGDRHHPVMTVMITFQVMLPTLQKKLKYE